MTEMNLIEKLGGYESAKAHVRELVSDYDEGVTWKTKLYDFQFSVGQVEQALLEHRRQHNIFEHGDYIVWLFDYEPSHLYIVKNITEKGYDYGNDWGWYGVLSNEGVGYNFRHATDAEIKAGKRLDVNQ